MPLSNWLSDPFITKNLTFGIEDSLISTTGVLLGIAAAKFRQRDIVVAGFILILVEALSMSYGAFLSDENFMKTDKRHYTTKQIMQYGAVMFVSYFCVGLILLLPYILTLPHASVWVVSIALVLLALLIVSYEHNTKRIIALLGIGAVLMTVSIVIGKLA